MEEEKKDGGIQESLSQGCYCMQPGNQSPGPAKPPREAPWLGPSTSRPHLSMAAAWRPLHFKQFRFPTQPQNWAPTSSARAIALIQTPPSPNFLFTPFVWDARSNWIVCVTGVPSTMQQQKGSTEADLLPARLLWGRGGQWMRLQQASTSEPTL